MKVTIVGAGNVGASCAEYIAIKSIASEVVLLDIKAGFAEGKALDLMQTATTLGFNSRITGVTNDYSATKDSDVVVITSGGTQKTWDDKRGIDRNQRWYCSVGGQQYFRTFAQDGNRCGF